MLSSGMNSSALEHSVPEQLFSTPGDPANGISAVKALKIANDEGIPIYSINQANIDYLLPQLQIDDVAKADIENAVYAGKEVQVSKTNITYSGWTGCGYIITDPITGAGAYMISGSLNGGLLLATVLTLTAIALLATSLLVGPVAVAITSILMPIYLTITAAIASEASEHTKLCLAKTLIGELGTNAVLPLLQEFAVPIIKCIMIVFHIAEFVECTGE